MARAARDLATPLAVGVLALAALVPALVLTGSPEPVAPGPARAVATPAAATRQPAGAQPGQRGPAWVPRRSQPAGWAPAPTAAIHPGVRTVTTGGGSCTSNFVFVAGGRRFLGQAAHCAGTGVATEIDGCSSGTRPLGTTVLIDAADGTRRAGRLVYSSWITMQSRDERDPATCRHNDFALVELAERDADQINPSLPGLGGPTGLRVAPLPPGTSVFGVRGPAPDPTTGRAALATGRAGQEVGAGFGHEVFTAVPGVPGESGSAFVDADGAAFGVLTTLNLAADPVSNGTTDLAAALAYANANGGLGPVSLALGTERFRVTGQA